MQVIDRIALILAIIGGLNWGSIGLFRFDLVAWICGGQASVVARVIYTLVGNMQGIQKVIGSQFLGKASGGIGGASGIDGGINMVR